MSKSYTIEQIREYYKHIGTAVNTLVSLTDLSGLMYLIILMGKHHVLVIDDETFSDFMATWNNHEIVFDECEQIIVEWAKQNA